MFLMHITKKYDKKEIQELAKIENLAYLHVKMKYKFEIPINIRKSDPPEMKLNSLLKNESIYSISFVRHPYKR